MFLSRRILKYDRFVNVSQKMASCVWTWHNFFNFAVSMERSKRSIIKLLIVLISIFCINGGKSLLLICNSEQVLFTYDLVNDIEITHQQHFDNFADEEKWLESFRFNFSSIHNNSVKPLFSLNYSPQEFLDSIWQPPKGV
jgi:hypothetical protein